MSSLAPNQFVCRRNQERDSSNQPRTLHCELSERRCSDPGYLRPRSGVRYHEPAWIAAGSSVSLSNFP